MKQQFGDILSKLRRERGLSQRVAAGDLGVSQALLSHYENGAREPKLEFVIRACDYYEVDADYLLGRTDEPRPANGIPLPCGTDHEHELACEIQQIFSLLREKNDEGLSDAAVNYLASASAKVMNLFADPYTVYDPMRDAGMKMAEAEFLINIRRVTDEEHDLTLKD